MITSLSNPRVKLVQRLQTQRRARHRERRMVVEGARLLEEALTAGPELDSVLFTAEWAGTAAGGELLQQAGDKGVLVFEVSAEIMAHCADTETPQGVLAVLAFPELVAPATGQLSFALVIDRLRTPGNLGTMLRTAAAARVELVLLPPGNVDPYNPKVVRGGMGAHFYLPILCPRWEETKAHLAGLDVWLAAAGKGEPFDRVDWTRPSALIVGGEASGVGDMADGLARGRVHVPMPGGIESLNAAVAAGVLLFEVVRQRIRAGES